MDFSRTTVLPWASHVTSLVLGSLVGLRQLNEEFPFVAQWEKTRLASIRTWARAMASFSGLRICYCHELRCMWQTCLESGDSAAEVWASCCSSDWTPGLGTSICHRCSPKKKPKKDRVNNRHHLHGLGCWVAEIRSPGHKWELCASGQLPNPDRLQGSPMAGPPV